jgi:hypothetical protein
MRQMADFDRPGLPFSRPLAVSEVPVDGLKITIRAEEKERAAIASANGLIALTRLEADFRVQRESAEGIALTGTLTADTRQTCVVTLEDFDATIVEPIYMRFAPAAEAERPVHPGKGERRGARRQDSDTTDAVRSHHAIDFNDDPPDPLIGGEIDLGAVTAEFLTLSLDPYPKKPGASFEDLAPSEDASAASPFAKLRSALKGGPPSDDF